MIQCHRVRSGEEGREGLVSGFVQPLLNRGGVGGFKIPLSCRAWGCILSLDRNLKPAKTAQILVEIVSEQSKEIIEEEFLFKFSKGPADM